jgi:hypothetical protein
VGRGNDPWPDYWVTRQQEVQRELRQDDDHLRAVRDAGAIEEDDDGFSSATCAICGLVVPYGGQDSPGTSPEPEDDDDAPTSDATTITYDADGTPRGSVDDV